MDADLETLIERALAEDVGDGDATTAATVDAGARGARDDHPEGAGGDLRARRWQRASSATWIPPRDDRRLGPEGVWREAGAVVLVVEGRRAGAADRRADGAELPRPAVGRRDADRARRVGACAARAGPRSCSTRARPRRACGGSRRRRWRRGGGVNHRAGLYDAILIKENHAALAGGVGEAVRRARAARPDLPLAVEVRDDAEIDEALAAGAPRLLLDNMTPGGGARGGRARGGPRGDRGVRRRRPRDDFGLCDHRWGRLRLDGRADALRARPRPLPVPGVASP